VVNVVVMVQHVLVVHIHNGMLMVTVMDLITLQSVIMMLVTVAQVIV
jgi:hypothetical protein